MNQNIITLTDGRIINNRIYCVVERVDFNIINGMEFDLRNEKHYLLLASGVEMRAQINSVGRHTSQRASENPYNLTLPGVVRPDNSRRVLVSVHGSLMVISYKF